MRFLGYNEDEVELGRLLGIVSDRGLKALDLVELDRLRILLQAKDYGDNKKANKSKTKLLKQSILHSMTAIGRGDFYRKADRL